MSASQGTCTLTVRGALLVYDITRRASFDRLAEWLVDARQNAQPRLGCEASWFRLFERRACLNFTIENIDGEVEFAGRARIHALDGCQSKYLLLTVLQAWSFILLVFALVPLRVLYQCTCHAAQSRWMDGEAGRTVVRKTEL